MRGGILSVSSQVAYGPVGNTAAVPAMQNAGFSVLQVPTIILSNHPGHGVPEGMKIPAAQIEKILMALHTLNAFHDCLGVMTGYFADPDQVDVVAQCLGAMKRRKPSLFLLVDPVMGDHESLYVSPEIAEAIRTKLVPLADCITPNRFELSWLSKMPVTTKAEAITAARSTPVPEVLATSVPANPGMISTLLITSDSTEETITAHRPRVPHGTGDFLAGLYLSHRLSGFASPKALMASMTTLGKAIMLSADDAVLDIIGALEKQA